MSHCDRIVLAVMFGVNFLLNYESRLMILVRRRKKNSDGFICAKVLWYSIVGLSKAITIATS